MTATATAAAKPAPLWEDFIDVLTSPSRVFERRRGSGFGVPLLILAVLFAVVAGAALPLMRPMYERQAALQLEEMRKRGMTEEQINSGRGIAEKMASVGAVAGQAIGIPIAVAIIALVLLGVARLFDANLSYRDAGLIATFAMVPVLLSMVAGAARLAVLDPETMATIQQPMVAPVLFLGRETSPVIAALATRFGVGDIWGLIITAVGVSTIGRVPRGRGFLVAAILWLLGTGVAVFFGARMAAMQG
jgi:hypothetical protein